MMRRRLARWIRSLVVAAAAVGGAVAPAFAQTGTVMPSPKFLGTDNNNTPISGGKLCSFQAGTTTPIATYSDVALAVANANPVILDSAGRATVYLTPGTSYKFILKTAGTDSTCNTGSTIWTQDNVLGTSSASSNVDVPGVAGEALSAGQVAYLSDGSGAKTAGQWYKADATNAYSSSTASFIGLVPSAIAQGASGSIRISGQVTGLSSLTIGSPYYVSGTAGSLTLTAPANRRSVGAADTATTLVMAAVPSLTAVGSGTASASTWLRGDQSWSTQWTVVTTTSTGTQNDFAPGLVGNTILRCSNATLLTITGLAGGYDGQRVILASVGAGQVDTAHGTSAAGLNSAAANRFLNIATSGNTSGAAGVGSLEYVYDATTVRWRLVAHEQGAWITPTYASGSYTAQTGTWTVDSGDVTTQAYYLKGRTLTVAFNLVTTSVSATPTSLNIVNTAWGGFTSAKAIIGAQVYSDNGAAFAMGYVATLGTVLTVNKITGTWAIATNTTSTNGQIAFEVQ